MSKPKKVEGLALDARSAQVPALPPHEALDTELRQRAVRLAADWLAFADLALEAIETQVWTKFRHEGPETYFPERIGLSWRTVQKWLTVAGALRALPEGERESAAAAVSEIGAEKAAILAPVLGEEGTWQGWVKKAAHATREALQEAVSAARGAKPRGAIQPGEAFYRALLARLPDDASRAEVEEAFALGRRVAGTENAVGIFLHMVREVIQEWRHRAKTA